MRILVAEDERDLNRILTSSLEAEHYSVDSCHSGTEALEYLESAEYDAAVLDIMMPGMDGLTVLKKIRQKKINTPVILLTARDSIEDRVSGLDAGANDYLVKPFSFQELEARIKALLRRSKEVPVQQLVCGDLILDCTLRRARRGNMDIDLTVKEYRLLEYFLLHQRAVLSRLTLLRDVWDKNFDTNTNVVDVYVNYLRAKIDKGFEDKLIHTVVGVGYMMTD